MKKLFALIIIVVAFSTLYVRGQATDLFISEWLDGSGGHQAIEIFNGTGAPVNMGDYSLKLSEKYLGWATDTTTGFVNPDTTLIWEFPDKLIANDSVYAITIITATRTGWTAKADTVTAATSSIRGGQVFQSWNGEDAIGLFKNNVLIDQVGPELSVNDTFWVAGVSSGGCDHTLVRKSTVFSGNTNWDASAGTDANNSEWIVAAKNNVTYWGTHRMFKRGNDILGFSLAEQFSAAVIDAAAHTVSIVVVHDTPLTALVPTITISDSADILPVGGIATDFTNPVKYTITSEAGTVQDWTVTVTVKKNTDATLSSLKVDDVNIAGFSASSIHYFQTLAIGTTVVPVVSAVSTDPNAIVEITQAPSVTGNAVILVKAEDATITKTYTVHFSLDPGYDLFISEWLDGSGGHQAIEIFNGTGAPINMGDYSLKLSEKYLGWATDTTTGFVNPDTTLIWEFPDKVLANDSVYAITIITATRTGWIAKADTVTAATSTNRGGQVFQGWNGDDAIGLFKNNVLIDQVGPEFSVNDTFWVAGVSSAGCDHTLVRKSTVIAGNTNWNKSAGTDANNSEWIVKAKNDVSNFGFHKMFSTETDILTLTLPELGKAAEIDAINHTINFEVVFGTVISALEPVITVSDGGSISPVGVQDFTNPVSYTVTAENPNFTQVWTVTAVIGAEPSHEANITSFAIAGETAPAEINSDNKTVTAHIAWDAAKTAISPEIGISASASIDLSGAQDFTSPVVYVVTAQDGTTKVSWTVTVVNDVEPSHEAKILSFTLTELAAPVTINETEMTITGELKPRTVASSLTPVITISEAASILPTGAQNFTNDVTYTVTAEDGTTVKEWVVTLTVQPTPITSVHDIQFTSNVSGDSPEKGKFVKTTGIVTGITSNSFFIQNGEGEWNGIMVKTNIAPTVAVGDEVTVEGTVKEDANLTMVTVPYLLVEVLSSGNAIPNPVEVAIADFTEAYEGVLVTLRNLICSDISGLADYKEWAVVDGNTTIYVDDDMYFQTAELNEYFSKISGVGTYALGNFRLLPRSAADVATSIANNEFGNIKVYPNPFTNSLRLTNLNNVSRIVISNALGQNLNILNEITNNMEINTTQLAKGMYVITIINKNGNSHSDVIIKK